MTLQREVSSEYTRKVVAMQEWQYKVLSYGFDVKRANFVWFDSNISAKDKNAVINRLNVEGKDGWELASIEKADDTDEARNVRNFYLKRPI